MLRGWLGKRGEAQSRVEEAARVDHRSHCGGKSGNATAGLADRRLVCRRRYQFCTAPPQPSWTCPPSGKRSGAATCRVKTGTTPTSSSAASTRPARPATAQPPRSTWPSNATTETSESSFTRTAM